MPISSVISILFLHFLGDWFFQSREMATNKSKSLYWLLFHLSIITITTSIAALTLSLTFNMMFIWIGINVICHGIQDWFLWRIAGKHLAEKCKIKEEVYNHKFFWDVAGIDQLLHYVLYFFSFWALSLTI